MIPVTRRLSPPRLPRSVTLGLAALLLVSVFGGAAYGFCGFYVAKADTHLYNSASQVVLARDGERTVMTMANDFKGDPKEFAVVIPVPTLLRREQIHVADKALIDHLDAYSAPRLVEYFDPDPCQRRMYRSEALSAGAAPPAAPSPAAKDSARRLGVTIEATYTIGEYDILILSARESDGLETWLRESGYRVPPGATRVLGAYIKQGLHFFVAKVDLREQSKLGFSYLRPLQVAYDSPRFMLPIRLGMVNAAGPQELFVYALSRRGRVETTNYRTVKLPSGDEVPELVKDRFGPFYKAMFDRQVRQDDMRTVFLEYAWDMGWCDPCAADPLSRDELRTLGALWLDDGAGAGSGGGPGSGSPAGSPRYRRPPIGGGGGIGGVGGPGGGAGADVFLTRLHVRYDAAHFPEDLAFQETGDRETFQGRYVVRHAFTGGGACAEAAVYQRDLHRRREQEARTLSQLTGWSLEHIRGQMNLPAQGVAEAPADEPWWKQLWAQ